MSGLRPLPPPGPQSRVGRRETSHAASLFPDRIVRSRGRRAPGRLPRRHGASQARRAGVGRQPPRRPRPPRHLRRADAVLHAQHLRPALSVRRQSSATQALACLRPHRQPRRPGVDHHPSRRQVSRRLAHHRRGRRLLVPSAAHHQAWPIGRLPAGAGARQDHRGRRQDRQVRAQARLPALPLGAAAGEHRQSPRHQGQREGRRLGSGLARVERGGLGPLHARCGKLQARRGRRPEAQPGPLHGLGRTTPSPSISSVAATSRRPTRASTRSSRATSTPPTATCPPTRWSACRRPRTSR